jgi:predicted small lipoprotein YifL
MKKLLTLLATIFVVVTLTGCGEKTAGEKLDDAVDSTKSASKTAWEDAKKAVGN